MKVSAIPEPWRPGEDPADCLARFASAADRRTTPCGAGEMVWHIFGDGAPLILLHGGHGAWTHWIRNIPALAQHFRLFVADMPGHGASDMLPEPISGPGIAAVISEGLQQLLPSGEAYHAAGFSFGGIIGGCLAARDGARMSTLTICGSNGLGLRRGALSGKMPEGPRRATRERGQFDSSPKRSAIAPRSSWSTNGTCTRSPPICAPT